MPITYYVLVLLFTFAATCIVVEFWHSGCQILSVITASVHALFLIGLEAYRHCGFWKRRR